LAHVGHLAIGDVPIEDGEDGTRALLGVHRLDLSESLGDLSEKLLARAYPLGLDAAHFPLAFRTGDGRRSVGVGIRRRVVKLS
jgi:hypothetical protein